MTKFLRLFGFMWALPLSLLMLAYVLLFSALGWYNFIGVREKIGLVWFVNESKAPGWLNQFWDGWAGHACGNVIVLKYDLTNRYGQITLKHELEHVRQCMKFGVFQPLLYALVYLTIKIGCRNSNPYFSNIFEVDARRGAGQLVDVEGTVKRAVDAGIVAKK